MGFEDNSPNFIQDISKDVLGKVVVPHSSPVTAEHVNNLREAFYETAALFKHHPLETHQNYWLWNLSSLSNQFLLVKMAFGKVSETSFDKLNTHEHSISLTSSSSSSSSSVANILVLRRELIEFNQWFMNGYNHTLDPQDTLELVLLLVDFCLVYLEEQLPPSDFPLEFIQQIGCFMISLKPNLSSVFAILVKYIKLCYFTDLVEELIPFIHGKYIYPLAPLDVESLEYSSLIDFYRYTAFVLSSPRLRDDKSLGSAAVYFHALLLFPSLSNSNIASKSNFPKSNIRMTSSSAQQKSTRTRNSIVSLTNNAGYGFPLVNVNDDSNPEITGGDDHDMTITKYILVKERQEIAFMYLIDYLLSMDSLLQLVNPSKHFKREVVEIRSIMGTIRQDMLQSVKTSSRQLITQSSSTQENSVNLTTLSRRCISSMLYHGTYNEIFTMIVQFFDHLYDVRGIMNSYMDNGKKTSYIERIGASIEKSVYQGKLKYLNIVNTISQRIEYLNLKHWVESTGGKNIPTQRITKVLGISEERLSLNPFIKDFCVGNQTGIVNFNFRENKTINEETELESQASILKTTIQMQIT